MSNEQDRGAWVNMVNGSTYREVTPMQKTTPEMRLKTFTGFLKFAEIDSNSKKSKLLFEIWNEAGSPLLKYGKRPMVNRPISPVKPRNAGNNQTEHGGLLPPLPWENQHVYDEWEKGGKVGKSVRRKPQTKREKILSVKADKKAKLTNINALKGKTEKAKRQMRQKVRKQARARKKEIRGK